MTIKSSQRAILLIITEEDGGKPYYLATESHFSWPGGRSGPTVGVGYDCGYETRSGVLDDWAPFIGQQRAQTLTAAAGITGQAAHVWVQQHRHAVTISWEEALAQFSARELPKWEAIVTKHLPNTDLLSGDSFGALVSLAYNRGPSFDAPGARYREMREIKQRMEDKRFDLIPGEFLSMRRIWPVGGDLWQRRSHEAVLFRDGLIPPPPAPLAPTAA
jgi:GH24 family phage-related lysozyme (muramidase)